VNLSDFLKIIHEEVNSTGRPLIDGEVKRICTVHLSDRHLDIARRVGHGNVSAGIRAALDAKETTQNG